MEYALKPTEIKLATTNDSGEEWYFVGFQMIALKKKEVEEMFSSLNEDNELVLENKKTLADGWSQ